MSCIVMGKYSKKVQEMRLKWWACDEKRGTLRRKKGDGNESAGEKEEKMIGQSKG